MTMQKAQTAETTTTITLISPVVEISLELLFSTKIDFLLDIKSYFQENYVDKNRITAKIYEKIQTSCTKRILRVTLKNAA